MKEVTCESVSFYPRDPDSFSLSGRWIVPGDMAPVIADANELAALREAVEVLEDMYEQRDAETERWFQKWMDAHSDYHAERRARIEAERGEAYYSDALDACADAKERTTASLRDAEAKVAELHKEKDASERFGNYLQGRVNALRERIRTYRATLQEISAYGSNSGATLARHVLNSEIHDGGADF